MSPPTRIARSRRLGAGAAVVVVLVVAAVTVVIGMLRADGSPIETVAPTSAPGATAAAALVYVHVDGAVAEPGLYRLESGSRVVDAVAAAGGFADGAERTAVNLARIVVDGEQLVVPVAGAVPPAGTDAAASVGSADGPIDLNSADAAALETLPRVGPALAERIVAWREENGRFTSVDDLLAVSGIGEKMLSAIRDLVRV